MKWVDATSYQKDKPRIATPLECAADDIRVTITTGHIYAPGRWVMHCRPWYDTKDIGPDTMEVDRAQVIALDLVRRKIEAIHAALGAAS